jgi:hypothetical protein
LNKEKTKKIPTENTNERNGLKEMINDSQRGPSDLADRNMKECRILWQLD